MAKEKWAAWIPWSGHPQVPVVLTGFLISVPLNMGFPSLTFTESPSPNCPTKFNPASNLSEAIMLHSLGLCGHKAPSVCFVLRSTALQAKESFGYSRQLYPLSSLLPIFPLSLLHSPFFLLCIFLHFLPISGFYVLYVTVWLSVGRKKLIFIEHLY